MRVSYCCHRQQSVIFDNLPAHFQEHLCNNKLIITGANAIPGETMVGVRIKRHDMAKSREANVIIGNQVMSAARHGYKTIHIVCDDTYEFVGAYYWHVSTKH